MEKSNEKIPRRKRNKITLSGISIQIIIISLISGIFNGLIGAGGGMILSLGLSSLIGDGLREKKDIYFNSQAAMVPVSLVSFWLYARSGIPSAFPFSNILFPAIAGGVAGGIASSYIDSKYIRIIFAAIVIFSGARMVLSTFI